MLQGALGTWLSWGRGGTADMLLMIHQHRRTGALAWSPALDARVVAAAQCRMHLMDPRLPTNIAGSGNDGLYRLW